MGTYVSSQVSIHVCTQPLKTASITHQLHVDRVRETGLVKQKCQSSMQPVVRERCKWLSAMAAPQQQCDCSGPGEESQVSLGSGERILRRRPLS